MAEDPLIGKDPFIGYVLKQYPRLSETFILHELLALQAAGVPTRVFSLRVPTEGRFHPALADYQGDVVYPSQLGRAAAADAFAAMAGLDLGRYDEMVSMLERVPASRRADLMVQAVAVARQAVDGGVTHFHAHFLTIAAHVSYLAHLLTGISFSVTAHAKDIYRHTVDWDLAQLIAKEAATIVTVCDANREHLEIKLGPEVNLRRIYNGLNDPEPPAPPSGRLKDLVVGVGRLVEKKGFDVLLDAVAILRAKEQPVQCVILGDGDQRVQLERQAANLAIEDLVDFRGAVTQTEVSRWLRTATVVAAPCVVGADGNQDALPTVLLEALAAGLPAVSTPVAGVPEIITDHRQGLLVSPGSATELADGIMKLLTDTALWSRLAAAGPIRLAERFSRESTADELIEVFTGNRLVTA